MTADEALVLCVSQNPLPPPFPSLSPPATYVRTYAFSPSLLSPLSASCRSTSRSRGLVPEVRARLLRGHRGHDDVLAVRQWLLLCAIASCAGRRRVDSEPAAVIATLALWRVETTVQSSPCVETAPYAVQRPSVFKIVLERKELKHCRKQNVYK